MIKQLLAAVAAPFLIATPTLAAPQTAVASWYGPGFEGNRTANGEIYRQNGISVAHKSLPFGTRVRICLPATGRCVIARVNDRGPFISGRSFDLSRGAADAIGLTGMGVGTITYEYL